MSETLRIKYGNMKLGDDTAVINMGTAGDCPSKKKGYCQVVKKGIQCYAHKAEVQYKDKVINYRKSQEAYWRNTSARQIARDITEKLSRRKKNTKYLRFNESGDFYSQRDVRKLSTVAKKLKGIDIIVYGYTARRDLDFSNVHFLVKGSNHGNGNNGQTVVIGKEEEPPEGFLVCPGDCSCCKICMSDQKINVAFRKH